MDRARGFKSMAVLALMCLAPALAHADTFDKHGQSDTLDKIRRTNTLVIAYPADHFPFAATGADGKPEGYAIDICEKVGAAVRRDLKLPQLRINFLPIDSHTRFEAIASGAADIECGSTTNNAARRAHFSFTVAHFYTTTRMMVRKASGIRTWSDLRGKRVVMVRASSIVPYVKARDASGVLNLTMTIVDTEADALAMLEAGQVDAYAEDDVLLYSYRSRLRQADSYEITGEPLSVDPYAMMMRRSDEAFKALVDRELVRMISDHEIYALYDRWFMAPVGTQQRKLGLPMSYLLRDSFHFPSDKVAQ